MNQFEGQPNGLYGIKYVGVCSWCSRRKPRSYNGFYLFSLELFAGLSIFTSIGINHATQIVDRRLP